MAHLVDKVRRDAEGLWLNIFDALVPEVRAGLDGDKILCPACRESLLRIDVVAGDGKTYCACGSRRGFDFIMNMHDIGFDECVNLVGDFLERPYIKKIDKNTLQKKIKDAVKDKQKKARRWNYELMDGSKALKSAPDSIIDMLTDWGWDGGKLNARWKSVSKGQYGPYERNGYSKQPCMLFTICNHKGRAVAMQIVPVDGKKTQTYYTKTSKSVYIDIWGKKTKYIAEGVKTSIAASSLHNCKVTPCVDANFLSRYTIKCKGVFADKDINKVGEIAAKEYCRLNDLSKKIIRVPDMDIPDGAKGVDFYDLLLQQRGN